MCLIRTDVRAVLLGLGLAVLSLTTPAQAADPESLLGSYNAIQRDEAASAEDAQAELTRLFDLMQDDSSIEDFALALSRQGYWAATSTQDVIDRLLEAEAAGTIGTNVAMNAIRRAEDQLDSTRRPQPGEGQLDIYRKVDALRDRVGTYPRDYQLLIDHFLVGAGEAALFEKSRPILNQPITIWRERALTEPVMAAAVGASDALDGLIAEYETSDYDTQRQRFYLNDLRHRAALLRFLLGRDDWLAPLQDIAANSATETEWYAPGFILDHVYVSKFFAIDDSVKTNESNFGQRVETAASQPVAGIVRLQIRQNYNPLQLSAWTCDTLATAARQDQSVVAIQNRLGALDNADYLVVLGHFNGKVGRFSKQPVSDLRRVAQEILDSVPADLKARQSGFGASLDKIRENSVCAALLQGYPAPPADLALFEGRHHQ